MTGPVINNHRGLTLAASAPAAGDATAITNGRGRSAAPACVALYPAARINTYGTSTNSAVQQEGQKR
jgi:hypothetical protein